MSPNSWSPERGPRADGTSHDQQLIWDLFSNYAKAAKILSKDLDYAKKIAEMQSRLLGPRVGKWGQLQEWAEDRDNPNDKHRHLSHFMAVHPGHQISPITTPKFAEAAKVSLKAKGGGGTGWSRAEKICLWARLHEAELAHNLVRGFFNPVKDSYLQMDGGGLFSNLLCAHPPFQIDGNFGYAGGVCEMLLQSHMGELHFLPALPKVWSDGSVKGMKARGGYLVDMSWKDGKLVRAEISSKNSKIPSIRLGDQLIKSPKSDKRFTFN